MRGGERPPLAGVDSGATRTTMGMNGGPGDSNDRPVQFRTMRT